MTPSAAAVDALFADWAGDDRPGCAVAVVRDGQVVYRAAFGRADLEAGTAMTPEALFYVASVSKQFTAACIVLLAEDGSLSLDDPVGRHLPEIADAGGALTLRHLLHHTGGLRDYLDLWLMSGRDFGAGPFGNDEALALLARQAGTHGAPGARHEYCNSGYLLLAELVRRVSGRSLRQFADERIFRPLGMARTWFDDDNAPDPARVVSYRPAAGGGWEAFAKGFRIVGSGGLLTTVDDLALWAAAFEAGAIGGPAFRQTMERPGTLADGTVLDYACGLVVGSYKGLPTVRHAGGMLGFRTHLLRFPGERLGVVCLGNASTFDAAAQAEAVADRFLADRFDLHPFAGRFRSDELDVTYRLEVRGADLVLAAPPRLAGPLRPVGPGRWRTAAEAGGHELDFGVDPGGGFALHAGRARGVACRRC